MARSTLFVLALLSAAIAASANPLWEDEDVADTEQQMDEPDIDQGNEIDPDDVNLNAHNDELKLSGLLENPELFEGDIENVNASDLEGRNAINDPTRKWNKLIVPYVISHQYSSSSRQTILQGMQEYHKRTCIKFVAKTNERDYIFIRPGTGCSSSVGRQGGRQDVSLGNGCVIPGIVVHELMHALGFWHEQSRPDRDKYVSINWSNIPSRLRHNFMKFSHGEVDTLRLPYDIGSVMHYGAYDFAINRRQETVKSKVKSSSMGQRRGFSKLDVQKVNKLYRCNMGKRDFMDD
uniref:Metalloendopeptidase n=1 Tax=Strigamia maritima TaxID=126957 RepID=T1J7X4_STRMM